MSPLPDFLIRRLATDGMIDPFVPELRRSISTDPLDAKVPSYGLSSYGYDARLAPVVKVFSSIYGEEIDPGNFDEATLIVAPVRSYDFADYVLLPPHSFALGSTVERFRIPRDVVATCLGKSTYARCGVVVNVTPLEPEWEGHVTMEFSNTGPLPVRMYIGAGIAQFIFWRSTWGSPAVSYADRGGKYQGQGPEIVPARG